MNKIFRLLSMAGLFMAFTFSSCNNASEKKQAPVCDIDLLAGKMLTTINGGNVPCSMLELQSPTMYFFCDSFAYLFTNDTVKDKVYNGEVTRKLYAVNKATGNKTLKGNWTKMIISEKPDSCHNVVFITLFPIGDTVAVSINSSTDMSVPQELNTYLKFGVQSKDGNVFLYELKDNSKAPLMKEWHQ